MSWRSQAGYVGSKQESAGRTQDLIHKLKVLAEKKFGEMAKQWPKKVCVISSRYYIEFYVIWSILISAISGRKWLEENLLITFKTNLKKQNETERSLILLLGEKKAGNIKLKGLTSRRKLKNQMSTFRSSNTDKLLWIKK